MTNAFALLRLPPRSDHDNDTEILVLRHQIAVLQRQLGDQRIRLKPTDRALLAALLRSLPRQTPQRLRLLVRPDTILRWHRDPLARRHAAVSRPAAAADRERCVRSAPWSHDWPVGTAAGATGASMATCAPSALKSRPPPSG
jgi:putative transposase